MTKSETHLKWLNERFALLATGEIASGLPVIESFGEGSIPVALLMDDDSQSGKP
jgi:hypothetical protein